MDVRSIQDLYRHMEWADALVWAEAVRRPETREDARLRELGGEPPLTDYVAWLWMDRPEPGWSRGFES